MPPPPAQAVACSSQPSPKPVILSEVFDSPTVKHAVEGPRSHQPTTTVQTIPTTPSHPPLPLPLYLPLYLPLHLHLHLHLGLGLAGGFSRPKNNTQSGL